MKLENDDEEYYVDYAADVAYDWLVNCFYTNWYEQVKEKYESEIYAGHLDKMERVYAKNGGPYILGEKVNSRGLLTVFVRSNHGYFADFLCRLSRVPLLAQQQVL